MKPARRAWWPAALAFLLLVAGAGLVALGLVSLARDDGLAWLRPAPSATPLPTTPAATATEPILPPPPTATATPTSPPPTSTPLPTATPPSPPPTASPVAPSPSPPPTTPIPLPTVSFTPPPTQPSAATPAETAPPLGLYTLPQRLGVGSGSRPIGPDDAAQLGFGWYLNWSVRADAFRSGTVEYVPMIRLHDGQITPAGDQLLAAVDALPGALWLIGNEPDVKWQDNVAPEAYAEMYHDLYYLLKGRDPTCQVAIGGVSQPTPLRLRYLDAILDAYEVRYNEPMPVDVWNVHNFVLREELGSWGVDIPSGMSEQTGRLYEISDHDDLAIFRKQIREFRQWMKDRGQQNKPLIVTEYGILMPAEYGFPPQNVERFMLDTFEFFRTAADPDLGYPADGGRLVQRWCWFSLSSERYPTGDLLRSDATELTSLGKAFAGYAGVSP